MNDREFNAWYSHHVTAFPHLGEWVEKNAGVLRHWSEALRDVTLHDAKAATDALVRGDAEEPKGPSGIPRVIRQFARSRAVERRPQRSFIKPIRDENGDWVYAYKCVACEDTGWRTVVSDTTIDEWRDGNLYDAKSNPKGRYRQTMMAVACVCDVGTERLPATRGVRFDKAKHLEWSCGEDVAGSLSERLAEFMDRDQVEKYGLVLNPDDYPGRLA